MTTTPEAITLTPETPSVVSWNEQLSDRPTEYLLRIVTGSPTEVDASHMYACQLLLEDRGVTLERTVKGTRGDTAIIARGPDGIRFVVDEDGNIYHSMNDQVARWKERIKNRASKNLRLCVEAWENSPDREDMAFYQAAREILEERETVPPYEPPHTVEEVLEQMEQALAEARRNVWFNGDIQLDEHTGYCDGVLSALRHRFNLPADEYDLPDEILDRFEDVARELGVLKVIKDEKYGDYESYDLEIGDDPDYSRAQEDFQASARVFCAAKEVHDRIWIEANLAAHKAAWQQGVKDADKYAPLLADLFTKNEAAD
jgi:hypothetical protein